MVLKYWWAIHCRRGLGPAVHGQLYCGTLRKQAHTVEHSLPPPRLSTLLAAFACRGAARRVCAAVAAGARRTPRYAKPFELHSAGAARAKQRQCSTRDVSPLISSDSDSRLCSCWGRAYVLTAKAAASSARKLQQHKPHALLPPPLSHSDQPKTKLGLEIAKVKENYICLFAYIVCMIVWVILTVPPVVCLCEWTVEQSSVVYSSARWEFSWDSIVSKIS